MLFHSFIVFLQLKITNQLLAVAPRETTFLPKKSFAQMPSTKFKKTSHYLQERKNFSVADLLSRSFFLEQLQLIHVKQKQLPPQVLFATLTHDDQIKLKSVQYLVKRETALPSLEDDCHPGLAHFGKDQFPIGNHNEGKNMLLNHWIPFVLMLYSQSKFHLKNQSGKMLKHHLKNFCLILIIRIRLGVENPKTKLPTELFFLYFMKLIIKKKTTFSLKNIPCTSEKSNDSADEKLQQKTIHQRNPSVME